MHTGKYLCSDLVRIAPVQDKTARIDAQSDTHDVDRVCLLIAGDILRDHMLKLFWFCDICIIFFCKL